MAGCSSRQGKRSNQTHHKRAGQEGSWTGSLRLDLLAFLKQGGFLGGQPTWCRAQKGAVCISGGVKGRQQSRGLGQQLRGVTCFLMRQEHAAAPDQGNRPLPAGRKEDVPLKTQSAQVRPGCECAHWPCSPQPRTGSSWPGAQTVGHRPRSGERQRQSRISSRPLLDIPYGNPVNERKTLRGGGAEAQGVVTQAGQAAGMNGRFHCGPGKPVAHRPVEFKDSQAAESINTPGIRRQAFPLISRPGPSWQGAGGGHAPSPPPRSSPEMKAQPRSLLTE